MTRCVLAAPSSPIAEHSGRYDAREYAYVGPSLDQAPGTVGALGRSVDD